MLITSCIRLHLGGSPYDFEVQTTMTPVDIQAALPAIRQLTDQLVKIASESAEKDGNSISCGKGCASCCRMAIPVSAPEAHRLREVVEAMPEPRQARIRERFARAMDVFRDTGILDNMFQQENNEGEEHDGSEHRHAYFAKNVPCPFLEEESCSIYSERPLSCRERIVTSPAGNCANLDGAGVERVPVLGRPAEALILAASDPENNPRLAVLPLVQLFEWTQQNPPSGELRIGPEWIGSFCEHLVTAAESDLQPPA